MPDFRITPRAREDLKQIGRYTLKLWGVQQRDTYLRNLDRRFAWLAQNPRLSALQHLFEQREARNRLGLLAFSSGGFIPWARHGRLYPVVRCTPATLHLRPPSFIVRAFGRGLPAYYAVC